MAGSRQKTKRNYELSLENGTNHLRTRWCSTRFDRWRGQQTFFLSHDTRFIISLLSVRLPINHRIITITITQRLNIVESLQNEYEILHFHFHFFVCPSRPVPCQRDMIHKLLNAPNTESEERKKSGKHEPNMGRNWCKIDVKGHVWRSTNPKWMATKPTPSTTTDQRIQNQIKDSLSTTLRFYTEHFFLFVCCRRLRHIVLLVRNVSVSFSVHLSAPSAFACVCMWTPYIANTKICFN